MNNKHYTSINQSKKLLSLGIDPESADMYYPYDEIETYPNIKDGLQNKNSVPCWSVGSLLELMPKTLEAKKESLNLDIYPATEGWFCECGKNWENNYTVLMGGKTLIEAVYSMSIWLLENNYLNKK